MTKQTLVEIIQDPRNQLALMRLLCGLDDAQYLEDITNEDWALKGRIQRAINPNYVETE